MKASAILLVAAGIAVAHPVQAKNGACSFPEWENTGVEQLADAIEADPACGLPWPALKRLATDPANVERLYEAYRKGVARKPERARIADELKLAVAAAAGKPEAALAFYDGNVTSHPEDKSLPNASCWVRGETGFDLQNAMPFCDKAVSAGRPAYSLVNRGIVNLLLSRNEAALGDFEEAISDPKFKAHPLYATALYGRGAARLRLGDRKAAKDIRSALKLNPRVEANLSAAGFKL